MISSEDFRKALRHFPAGVTIVTVRAGDQIHGLTVSAFASVSADPPMIMIIIENRHRAYSLLQETEAVFAVNILGEEQSELSNRFAWVKDEDRFTMGDLMMITVLRFLRHTKLVAEIPNLAAYLERGQARPAFQRALKDQLDTFAANQPQPEGAAA